jgi:hypothetical protein
MNVVGAFVVRPAGAVPYHCVGWVAAVPLGSKSRANAHGGSLGTWEIPSFSTPELPGGTKPAEQVPGSCMGRTGMHESE